MSDVFGGGRLARLRELMAMHGYDAVIARENADLRWLTGAQRVFDDEVAHTAVVSTSGAWLHTDSRYFGSFEERLGAGELWQLDMETSSHPSWAAKKITELKARVVAIEDTVTLGFFEELGYELNRLSAACLMPRLHGNLSILRIVKDEEEISCMRYAQRITDTTFEHLCDFIRSGQTELDIRAELEGFMLSNGAEGLSFDTIIASGPNGANPHARPSERIVSEGDMVVMDYGATYADYHSDMTRTICVGEAGREQRIVYDVVRRAHETCAKEARPGMTGKELHELAARVIAEAGYGAYFNHGLGHGVGLQIHERPFVSLKGADPIPSGAVFTIEPGVYLPGRFGVRLEDFGVMTESGYEPFTASTHDLLCL